MYFTLRNSVWDCYHAGAWENCHCTNESPKRGALGRNCVNANLHEITLHQGTSSHKILDWYVKWFNRESTDRQTHTLMHWWDQFHTFNCRRGRVKSMELYTSIATRKTFLFAYHIEVLFEYLIPLFLVLWKNWDYTLLKKLHLASMKVLKNHY